MKVFLYALLLLIFSSVQCKAQETAFSSTLIGRNLKGKIEVNFTLQDAVNDTTQYTVFIRCYNANDTADQEGSGGMMNYGMEGMMNDIVGTQDGGTLTCANLTANEPIAFCCTNKSDSCLVNNMDFSKFLIGAPIAGQQYNCTASIAYGEIPGPPPQQTGPISIITGRPPKPDDIDWIAISSNMTLNIVVNANDNTGLGDDTTDGLSYRVQVTDANDEVVHDNSSMVRAFSVPLDNSDTYTIRAWVMNIYGTSEPITLKVDVEFEESVLPSSTVMMMIPDPTSSPTPTDVESAEKDSAPVGAIAGGVVGGAAAVGVAAAVVVAAAVLVRNSKKKGQMKVAPE